MTGQHEPININYWNLNWTK